MPALTLVLTFRPRDTVWLWLVALGPGGKACPALTFDLIFIPVFLPLDVEVERPRHILGFEAGIYTAHLYTCDIEREN